MAASLIDEVGLPIGLNPISPIVRPVIPLKVLVLVLVYVLLPAIPGL